MDSAPSGTVAAATAFAPGRWRPELGGPDSACCCEVAAVFLIGGLECASRDAAAAAFAPPECSPELGSTDCIRCCSAATDLDCLGWGIESDGTEGCAFGPTAGGACGPLTVCLFEMITDAARVGGNPDVVPARHGGFIGVFGCCLKE